MVEKNVILSPGLMESILIIQFEKWSPFERVDISGGTRTEFELSSEWNLTEIGGDWGRMGPEIG